MATHSKSDNAKVSRERARLLKAQAQLRELELSEKRGECIPVDEVAKWWERLVGDCRAKLVALPSRLAPQVVGCSSIAEVKELLERAIFECLDELAAGAGVSKRSKGVQKPAASARLRVG